ncbi:MAG TPA: metallophosphoesterase [Verrucomicrobiae bacterium]|nr:metallophosphoesterase [Verrucomicrobiae bacterium]
MPQSSPPALKPKGRRLTRRQFLAAALCSTPLGGWADARCIEPTWLRVKRLQLTQSAPKWRLVQISDIHHKGDDSYLESVVTQVNALAPDVVLFTGDLIEEAHFLEPALKHLSRIRSPVFGIPGNHDYWSRVSFDPIHKALEGTGGGWLLDQSAVLKNGNLCIHGATCLGHASTLLEPRSGMKNVLLIHYPGWVEKVKPGWDLILAGHSHGGQVRIPFYGPIILPFAVGKYDMGYFDTPNGSLYVNPGIGWFPVPIRFNCRPEITLIEL